MQWSCTELKDCSVCLSNLARHDYVPDVNCELLAQALTSSRRRLACWSLLISDRPSG